ncbi:MAG: tetratricopeptide repeat protein [Verrucomicrobia bacterium]|jgi:tetratricopeptide (TPR) repeat protein|nr:tetratricopeptide repeat protein [Verrucomicrobiota bacterium]
MLKLLCLSLIVCPIALGGTVHGQSTDLASNQLLAIAEEEAAIYRKIAEDPDFYSESDLNRRIDELVQSYRRYLADQPDDASAYVLYGKLLRRLGEYDQAFVAFLKADELDPGIAVVKQQIGNHLAEQGKGKAALTFYLNAVSIEPETAVYHFGLGQLLHNFRSEFIDEGIFTRDALEREMLKAFRQAATIDPENFDFQMRLGEAYYDLSSPDWKRALVHWNKLRKKAATDLQGEILDLHRARVLGKLGRLEEARKATSHVENPALQNSKQQVLQEIAQH